MAIQRRGLAQHFVHKDKSVIREDAISRHARWARYAEEGLL
jgi:hypothetical protein